MDVPLGDGRGSVEVASQGSSCVEPAVSVVRWRWQQCGFSTGAVAQAGRMHDCSFISPLWLLLSLFLCLEVVAGPLCPSAMSLQEDRV